MLSKLALQKSVTVTGAKYSCHISYLTSDRVWISDGYNNLILTNTEGEKLHQLTDVISGDGVHTVNKDGELIYIDKNYNIIKLSLDKTKSSIINYTEAWRPRCVYSSPSTGDLLVVMFNTETDENKVARYNSAGENTQTIQHDSKGQELYKFPKYITENRNGDVIVSDLVHDVVVTDRGGNHRFSYTGPPSGNRLDPRGICTDAMLNILVCSHNTHTVQIIDKDGNFLSLVETSNHGMERPFGLSYNDKTHLLWVGSRYKNKVNIYRCLYGDSQIGLPLENLKCTRHPSDTLGKYCTQCEVDLCGKCIATSDEHKKHDVKEVEKLFRDIQKKENSSNQKQRFKVRMEEQNQTDDVTEHPSEFSDEKVSNIDEPEINGGKNQAASEEVDVEESTTPNTINTETEPYEPEEVAKPNEKEEEELGENDTNVSENAENLGILRVSKNVSEEPEKRITMVDFAGQCAYYASHQIFLSPRAFFILVLNMQKTLDDKVGEEVCSQKDSIFNGWTYRDYLIFWAKSIHQYSSEKAPALLVGTHAEGKTQREKVQFFRDIWETLETTDKSLQSHFNTKKMFAIGFDNRECIENIKRSIVDIVEDLDHWGEKLPHSWAMFENFFQEKKKLRIIGRRILLDFNEALPKEVKLQTLGDINTMLQFFHDIREILFFDKDILRDVIILDVQWFADAFKNVITDENHAEEDLIECAVEFAKFNETGELNDTLLSKIWKMSNREYIEYQNDIMLYMEKLALLAKIDEHNWYVPCMNKKQFPGNIFSQFPASSILCYMFDVLPAGIFQRLVVSCIQFPWSIVKERKGRKEYPCIYQTAVVFLFKEHNILLGMTSTEIQLQVCVIEGEVEIPTCFEIREKIENELNILSSTFQKNSKYHIGFKCKPEGFCDNEKSTIINESDLKNPTLQCISCPVERKHIINTKDITKYWKQVEDDSEEGNLHVLSIEMILNAVSRKLKVTSFMLASHCDVQMEESSKIFEEENRFRILYKWKCKTPVKDRFEELKRILRNQNDLKEAADSVETFQVTDFECSDIVLPSEVVSTNEFHILAEKIPKDYTHFVRFLGLPHIHIEELEVDGSPVKDRIYKSLLKLKEHHSKLSRLDICRALKFIERNDVIDDLNKIWTLGKKN
ncbi:uncharacterized protein LOC134261591 isoform X2 [Saccostrea cucullata]|uniref:uncharacterized protein LOC134261591 isoform X2 n=1 Tax=Saccostrea cuccullata TaxID=36930 RepID=UPI002ED35FC4